MCKASVNSILTLETISTKQIKQHKTFRIMLTCLACSLTCLSKDKSQRCQNGLFRFCFLFILKFSNKGHSFFSLLTQISSYGI